MVPLTIMSLLCSYTLYLPTAFRGTTSLSQLRNGISNASIILSMCPYLVIYPEKYPQERFSIAIIPRPQLTVERASYRRSRVIW
jgi:hypothetical protein